MKSLRKIATFFPLTSVTFKRALVVFLVYFLLAKLGLFIYLTFETSPALIWPSIGIGLAAVLFGGYTMWLPIFIAQHLAVVSEYDGVATISLIIAAAYALQAVCGLYFFRKLGFQPKSISLKNILLIVGAAFLVTMIEPAIATFAQLQLGTLTTSLVTNFARAWGAGIFSVIIIVPFLVAWHPLPKHLSNYLSKHLSLERLRDKLELVVLYALLVGVSYLLFSTQYLQFFGISIIFFLPIVLIWLALRFHPRFMTLALLIVALIGIAGTLLSNVSGNPINQQLLSVQIYVGFVAAIFLVFAAVVEERRAAHRKMEEALQESRASDKAKSEFLAILAHELRNPLAPIVSALEFLHLQPQTRESKASIVIAEDHAAMMRRLLDDLLDTVRLTQHRFELQKEVVSLHTIVQQSIDSVRAFIQTRKQKLTLTMPTDEILVFADPIRLKQILINLLNNACKYTDEDGRIELVIEAHDKEIAMRVSDTGRGIDPDELDTIFEPFRRTGRDSGRGTGLGIGLYLAEHLILKHGGRIIAKSEGLGHGSTFTIYLPRVYPSKYDSKKTAPQKHGEKIPAKILIVDDNEAAADSLQKLLTYYGHETQVAYSGVHALQAVDHFQPEVLLLDIHMPEMDGIEVAKRLRQQNWSGMLVALSGFSQQHNVHHTHQNNFDHHLVKPVQTKDILSIIGGRKRTQ